VIIEVVRDFLDFYAQPAVTVTYMSSNNLTEAPVSNNGLMESTFALLDKLEKAETGKGRY
jgi:hypothetical protein